MGSFYEITTCLKSRQFEEATNLLKTYQRDIDGRTTFKLLRTLASQLKINPSNKEDEDCVNELIQVCCAGLDQSQDLTADDTEFTQGVLSLYHLVTLSLNSPDKSEICLLLSKTILGCLRKIDKSLKDVQSIAANLFSQVWSISNKVNSELCFSYRSVALLMLIHGGTNFWNRLIEKLTFIVQEPSNASFQLAGSVFDEVLLYCNNHKVKGSFCVSSLLQVWTHLVLLSNSSNLHQDRTSKLKLLAIEIQENHQVVSSLIELVLNVFGDSDEEIDFSPHKWNNLLNNDFQIAFVRITTLTLNYLSVVINQSVEAKWDRKNQIISIIKLLLYICQEGDRLGSVVEANTQMDPINWRIKCLTRACSASFHLIKLDFSKIFLCQTVFYHINSFKKQGIVEQNKSSSGNYLNSAEIYANNIGIISTQRSDYVNAVIHYRKALEYHIMNVQKTVLSNGEVPNCFTTRFSAIYDSRKVTRDWVGIIEDFGLCFSAFYDCNEANVKVRCKSAVIECLFAAWSRFKRDVHLCPTTSNERFLEMTVVDLFKQINVKLDNDSAWSLLFEEYQSLDQRRGLMPKAAFGAVAQQAFVLAKSPFQKGVSSFFQSREGDDFVQRHQAAKKAIAKLALQTTVTDCESLGQVYLALAYVELYVSQQQLLKKKTEEEMESLGPLIQSSSNVDVRPGEDGTHLNSDGTSLDAVSYSYLKLELEFKNQDWMVKSLQQWEELVQFGWYPKQYSSLIFNCVKSLGYYFSLIGNSFFSARAWSVLLKLAESAKSNEDLLQSAAELLKRGWKVDSGVLVVCKDLIEKKEVLIQDQLLFHLGMAWSQYLQHNFVEAWQILDVEVLQSSAINTESPSKSVLLLLSQANLLRSLLAVLPEELSHIPPSEDIGPVQAGVKAAQTAYTALKCYTIFTHQQQRSWEYYGQEWNFLGHFLVGAINVSRIYLYIAAPREARFFLKEALNAAQKHVSVLRTAEALLELCNLDLMLDNTIDCQSKLVLICHLMGVAPPVIPDSENIAPLVGKKSFETPMSPVQIRTDRRKGIAARNVPEIPIQVQQDATQRALQLPLNHQGASPTTKAREVSDGIFPEHVSDCICLTCSGELIMSIRCSTQLVQSKLWSLLGFQDLANEDFLKGHQLVQSVCSRLRSSTKSVAVKSSSKRLFDVPDCLKINEVWSQYKMNWFQPPIITGMELLYENAMHRLVTESTNIASSELLAPVKAVLYEFYLGPLEHRVIKLTSAIATITLQQPATCFTTPEQCKPMIEEEDDDVIILEGDLPPKTPAIGLRKPLEIPAPRRVRRNLMAVKVDDTITIDDDEDSDGGFSRRRLGKPQKAILYSSDSDSDVLPPTPPPPPKVKKTKAVVKKKTQEIPPPTVEFSVLPVEKKYPSRGTLKSSESKNEDLDIGPVKEKRSTAAKTKSNGKTTSLSKVNAEADLDLQQPAASAKVENRFFKSKTASSSSSSKKELEVNDLSSRLAATKINPENTETKETRPKRTTRSTRK